jgi:CheY-like chemotaxis protein
MAVSALVQRFPGERDRDETIAQMEDDLVALKQGAGAFLDDPSDVDARTEIASRFRHTAAGAAALEWTRLAVKLSRCEAIVRSAAVLGSVDGDGRAQLSASLDELAATIAADRERERTPTSGPLPMVAAGPGLEPRPVEEALAERRDTAVVSIPIVVAGPRGLTEMVRARGAAEGDGYCFAIRQMPVLDVAARDIKAAETKPHVIVVDSDEPGADALMDELLGDTHTDEIPIVVVGTWSSPEQAARYVALGAARCIAKPLSAGELRRACADVSPGVKTTAYEPLGATTLDGLGARLADELQRGLCDAAEERARRKSVDLGDGSAVLTVLWDAVARIRELVTAQSAGEVRFHSGAAGALPTGVALTRSTQRDKADRGGPDERVTNASLIGSTVLVAEEDLSTNWFLSGVLREAGATVVDAFDGDEAMKQALQQTPDVVIAGLGLSGMTGLSVARALRSDVLLRDVPVLFLANDAAQVRRIQELGEDGARAIFKGASSEMVAQRLRELLRPRQSLAQRIAGTQRVHGRLDGIVPFTLLRMTGRARSDARVTIQSGTAVYEVELRAGVPVRACRTSAEGELCHGVEALAGLFSVCGGRFSIESSAGEIVSEIESGFDAIAEPLARVRALQSLVSGTALMRVERVAFKADAMSGVLAVTPEPARTLLGALMTGRSPRKMIAAGEVAAELCERVLLDAIRKSAVESIDTGGSSIDLPTTNLRESFVDFANDHVAAVSPQDAPAILVDDTGSCDESRESRPPRSLPRPSVAPMTHADWRPPWAQLDDSPFEPVDDNGDEIESVSPQEASDVLFPAARVVSKEPPRGAMPDLGVRGHDARRHTPILVSRLAVTHELPRQSDTPILTSVVREKESCALALLDVPRKDVVSERSSDESDPASILVEALEERESAPRKAKARKSNASSLVKRESKPGEPIATVAPDEPKPAADEPSKAAPRVDQPSAPIDASSTSKRPRGEPVEIADVDLPRSAMPSSYATRAAPPRDEKKTSGRYAGPILFAVVGVALAVGARYWRYRDAPPMPQSMRPEVHTPGMPVPNAPPGAAVQEPKVVDGASEAQTETESAPRPDEPPQEIPLNARERKKVEAGQGLLEIVAGRSDDIFLDGRRIGDGPVQRIAVPAGAQPHEVRVKMRGEERVRYVVAKEGVKIRLRVAPPWSH